jgi:hypothetical protein
MIENALVPLGARPHWGKNFSMPASDYLTTAIYPKLGDFKYGNFGFNYLFFNKINNIKWNKYNSNIIKLLFLLRIGRNNNNLYLLKQIF